jgi:fimbrial chaperone protein
MGYLLGVCLAALPAVTWAAVGIPIAVSPVVVQLDPTTDAASVQVRNDGDTPIGFEIKMVRVQWSDGKEQYDATGDFVVSPPSFRLQGGQSRMVRFKYTGARQADEGFYRLFINQLPNNTATGQVDMLFNLGVAVFIAPTATQTALDIANSDAAGQRTELRNTGNVSLTVMAVEGAACSPGVLPVMARVAPRQKLVLSQDVSRCATIAQTDKGPVSLRKP